MMIHPKYISAGILAGGTNLRNAGEPKALIPVEGKPIIEWQLELLHQHFSSVMLNVRDESWHKVYSEQKVYDEIPGIGPIGGIHALLKACNTPWLFVVPCDMPHINATLIDKLIRAMDSKAELVLYAVDQYKQPFPLLIRKSILPDIEKLIFDRHLRRMFDFLWWFKKKIVVLANVPSLTHWFTQYSRHPESSASIPSSKRVAIKRYKREKANSLQDVVVSETRVAIWLDKALWFQTVALDTRLKELAIGRLYLVEELVVSSEQLRVEQGEDYEVKIHISTEGVNAYTPLHSEEAVVNNLRISGLMTAFSSRSKLYKATGGVHSVAIVKERNILQHFEDISRHHAIDKAIGYLVTNHESVTTLLLSCRMTEEIVEKLFRAGIRQVISLGAPTFQAIRFAEDRDMELIGFARGGRFNKYTSL
ncbi:MAG: formate dehydrogenase accessory sulfurtransferase FdhD [Bacteroidales bacterium]